MGKYAGFNQVQLRRPSRSTFDLTHDKRLSMKMGNLTPVLMTECVPGDSFRGSSEILLRLAPLLAPIYDQIQLYVHYFFIPNRILWTQWEEFITGGRLGVGIDPVNAPIPPRIDIGFLLALNVGAFDKGKLADYLGVPPPLVVDPIVTNWDEKYIDAMPFAAYYLVWYEYYRDRNFVDDTAVVPLPSGSITNATANTLVGGDLRLRNYLHDYFTSALPFTQRGEEVLMPVQLGGKAFLWADPVNGGSVSSVITGIEQPGAVAVGYGVQLENGGAGGPGQSLWVDGADFDGTSTSINDFRSAYALQVWLERNAIGGSRYTESTQAHFGVKPQDSRLQRPEYIGGGRIAVKISEVLSTSWSTDGDDVSIPLANMGGHGVTYGNTNQFNYFCTEHGFILGIASIMNPPSYCQGLPRMFKRETFLDYPWPTFAKLGEQQVNDYEIYFHPDSMTPDTDTGEYPLFGYQSRYADWKYIPNTNHGEFRDTLLFWTLTRVFSDQPTLSEQFNDFDETTAERIFAVNQEEDNFWLYVHNKVTVKRCLPYFGTPNTLGFGS